MTLSKEAFFNQPCRLRNKKLKKILPFFLFVFLLLPIAAKADSVYDRVIKTQTIKCGYFLWPPLMVQDVNTGKFSGPWFDYVEKIGNDLNLKIIWHEEVSFSGLFEGFKNGRYDMLCSPTYVTPARAIVADFTVPMGYVGTYVFARVDDKRFDNNYKAINKPDVKFGFLEGEFAQTAHKEFFPLSQPVSAMNITDGSAVFMDIVTGKADATVMEPSSARTFMKGNPDKLKQVSGEPLRVQAVTMGISQGEEKFRRMVNHTIGYLNESGYTQRLFETNMGEDNIFLPPAKLYRNN